VATVALVLLFGAIVVAFGRLVRGPELADRAVAFDVIGSALLLLMIVLGLSQDLAYAFEIFLTLAFLSFTGTLALAALIERTGRLQGLEADVLAQERSKHDQEAPRV
jgi:multicomponent Na+:H+ antiporter subunit F